MADQLKHRGPDDTGVWQDGEAGIALGHTRLSIQDVSSHGISLWFRPPGDSS